MLRTLSASGVGVVEHPDGGGLTPWGGEETGEKEDSPTKGGEKEAKPPMGESVS